MAARQPTATVPGIDAGLLAARAAEIIAAGGFFAAHGWAPATAGNYSARLDADHLAITVSGCHKGQLGDEDVMVVDLAGRAIGSARTSSAETLLHTQLMADYPAIGAVLHTHSVAATVLSMIEPDSRTIILSGYELLKIFDGCDTHDISAVVPVFDNSQDIAALSAEVRAELDTYLPPPEAPPGLPAVPGYLIRGHGVYTWGTDMTAARHHAEALEFLFACELERARIGY